jgi:hypothetical protein
VYNQADLLRHIHQVASVYTSMHFVYTGGAHGDGYVNYRTLGNEQHKGLLTEVSLALLHQALQRFRVTRTEPVTVIGPETLGAKMLELLARNYGGQLNPVVLTKTADRQFTVRPGADLDLAQHTRTIVIDDLLNEGTTLGKARRATGPHPDGVTVIGDRSGLSPGELGVEQVILLEQFTISRYSLTEGPCRSPR